MDGMMYPSWYFWRAAIHGYNPVPTYPYSHGCVRVPPWTAQWMYDHAPMKAEVLIYH
jgi:lipoprotein-anchoring transpeptidase ErfK/SrfK